MLLNKQQICIEEALCAIYVQHHIYIYVYIYIYIYIHITWLGIGGSRSSRLSFGQIYVCVFGWGATLQPYMGIHIYAYVSTENVVGHAKERVEKGKDVRVRIRYILGVVVRNNGGHWNGIDLGKDSPAGSPNNCTKDSVGWMLEEYGLTFIRDLHHGAYEQAFAKQDKVSEASNIRVT